MRRVAVQRRLAVIESLPDKQPKALKTELVELRSERERIEALLVQIEGAMSADVVAEHIRNAEADFDKGTDRSTPWARQ